MNADKLHAKLPRHLRDRIIGSVASTPELYTSLLRRSVGAQHYETYSNSRCQLHLLTNWADPCRV
eukprot:scaffold308285_cov32-Tisochrysis_lutea.AAC.1